MNFTFHISRMKMLVPFSQNYCKDFKEISYMAIFSQKAVHIVHDIFKNLNNSNYSFSINSRLHLDFISFSINVFFSPPEFNLGNDVACGCHGFAAFFDV